MGDITQQYTASEVALSIRVTVQTTIEQSTMTHYTKLTIIGNETGAQKTVDLTIKPQVEIS